MNLFSVFRNISFIVFTLFFTLSASSQIKKENRLLIGRLELSDKNYQTAIEHLNVAIQNAPLNYEPFYYRSIAKFELGDIIGAESDLNKAIKLEPRSIDLYILRGTVKDRLLKYEEAFENFNKALKINNKNPDIYINRAIVNSNLQEHQKAIDDCELALRYKSRKELVYIIRGMSLIGLKKYRPAISDFNLVIENSPFNATNYVRRASAYYYLNRYDSALADINYALHIDPKNSYAFFQRALISDKQENQDKAINDLNKVIELAPNSTSAYYNRALIYSKQKNLKAALNDYNKVILINNKNILAYFNRAIILQQLKRLKEAKSDVEKTIELYPDFVDAYKVRSSIKQDLGDYYGAEQDKQTAEIINNSKINISDSLKRAEELYIAKVTSFSNGTSANNNSSSGRNDISLSPAYGISLIPTQKEKHIIDTWNKTNKSFTSYYLYHLDDNDVVMANTQNSVLAEINTKLEKKPDNAELYLKRAIVYTSLNQYDKAIIDLNKSIHLDPSNHIAYFCRATMIYGIIKSLNDTENSNYSMDMVINDYDKCLKENPNFGYAYFNRANLKCQKEDYIGAIEDYGNAINVSSTFSEAYLNRALILLILDNNEQACKDLSKAGELGNINVYDIIGKYCNK